LHEKQVKGIVPEAAYQGSSPWPRQAIRAKFAALMSQENPIWLACLFLPVVIPAKAGIQGCKSLLVALDPSPDLIRAGVTVEKT
jgi:hypothetical protein